jgi:hypothetical protein
LPFSNEHHSELWGVLLIVLAFALLGIYITFAGMAQYLCDHRDAFVLQLLRLVVQLFEKVPSLHALAPTQRAAIRHWQLTLPSFYSSHCFGSWKFRPVTV